MKRDCAIIVFAKAPVAGYAKTRLAGTIGSEAAARLAARMLHETLRQAVAADIGPVELCCAPNDTHAEFRLARKRYGVVLTQQGEGDLGVRMRNALERAFRLHQHALLIGTDSPQIDPDRLRGAAHLLQSRQAVFIPTTDGGYFLVGLSRMIPELFTDIAWSTPQVMRQTQERLEKVGIAYGMLPSLSDIDEPKDLHLVPQSWWDDMRRREDAADPERSDS